VVAFSTRLDVKNGSDVKRPQLDVHACGVKY
jgi:hypothetical protein